MPIKQKKCPITLYRDGLEEQIDGLPKVQITREGHTVEKYTVGGNPRFFVTLSGSCYCAHGNTIAEAVTDAKWKDPKNRPSMEALVANIRAEGEERKISLNEFILLTGACRLGCQLAIKRSGVSGAPMTAYEIKQKVSREWGDKLLQILAFEEEHEEKK